MPAHVLGMLMNPPSGVLIVVASLSAAAPSSSASAPASAIGAAPSEETAAPSLAAPSLVAPASSAGDGALLTVHSISGSVPMA